jgi:pimeloyl-ACP methyl ester carboxylesterase
MEDGLMTTRFTGTAAGVPYVALAPASGPRPGAPVVLAWHLFDAPRTEDAFAAALPLDGLDAWRIYLGLPLTGKRLPAGGWDAVMRLGYEDAVLKLYAPSILGAAEETVPALAALRAEHGIGDGPLAVLGGSAGAAVAQLVAAEAGLGIRAAVLVSPVVRLRPIVAAVGQMLGVTYGWTEASDAVADRLDFVARAGALRGTDVLLVVGEDDDRDGVLGPAAELHEALGEHAALVTVPGMAHALADEPGVDPAPQVPHAATVDRHASAWLAARLGA